jgi:hypothetical protein
MNAFNLAEAFMARFAADEAFAGLKLMNDQEVGDIDRPGLIFAVTTSPMNASGSVLTFTLNVWVETEALKNSEPPSGQAHAAAVGAVKAKLIAAGKAALIAELNVSGAYDFRGWSALDGAPGMATEHFRDPVAVVGTVRIL